MQAKLAPTPVNSPELGTNLVAALASLHVDDLTARERRGAKGCETGREKGESPATKTASTTNAQVNRSHRMITVV